MSQTFLECPQCGRPFSKFSADGKIGFCDFHKEWFPCDESARVAAYEANKKYQEEQRQKRLAQEAEERRREAQQENRKKLSLAAKISAVAVALLVIAAAVFWFAVLPRMNYREADALLAQGAYSQARQKFGQLNGYGDSAAKIVLCDAFLALQQNDVNGALEKLDALDEDSGLSDGLKISICDAVANWRSHGISAEGLLTLLERIDDFDPNGTLDVHSLSVQAHTALADDGALLDSYTEDINGDGEDDLVVLKDDYTVTAYRMLPSGNGKVTLDRSLAADCLTAFGDRLAARDAARALACYQAAYETNANDATAARFAAALQARATRSEADEDYAAALADADLALETAGTGEAFSFLYEMTLRRCYAEADRAQGIAEWDAFAAGRTAALQKYEMNEEWLSRAAELRLAYAEELASWKDGRCLEAFQDAAGHGADVAAAAADAAERFDLGLTRIRLRQLAQEAADDSARAEQTARLADDLGETLAGWTSLGVAPRDALALLNVPEAANLSGIDAAQIYREAALAAAAGEGALADSAFVDWNAGPWEALLALTRDGALKLYTLDGEFAAVWSDALPFPAGALVARENQTVLAEAADGSGFAVYAWGDGALERRIAASGLYEYARGEDGIDCALLLPGSIARSERYHYDLNAAPAAAELVGVDWQQADYPLPETAADAVVRYLEARAYGLDEEAARLTAAGEYADGAFPGGDALAALPLPADVLQISARPYEVREDVELFEAVYPAESGEQCLYVAAVDEDGWKIAGTAEAFTAVEIAAPEARTGELIALDAPVTDRLASAEDSRVYRALISAPTKVQLVWQAGDEAGSRDAFQVNIVSAADPSAPVTGYALRLAPATQMANPLFLAPGVYYVTVAPLRYEDCDFTLTLRTERDPHMETEANDTIAQANVIELNQDYAASLYAKEDVDLFAFTLAEPSAVRVALSAEAGSAKASRYTFALAERASGKALVAASLSGQDAEAATGILYLGAGDYVVQVSKGDSWTAGEYRIRVEAETSADTEIEGNDTLETATPLAVNAEISGTFAAAGDVDCFAFALEGDAVVQPRFRFEPLESSSRAYVLTILDAAGEAVVSYSVGGKETAKVFVPYALPAGDYFLRLENPRFAAQGYALTLVSQPVALAEREPNDALAQANELPPAAAVTALLASDEDVDFYKITLAEEALTTLDFAFEPAAGGSGNAFTVSLEQNGKNLWSQSAAAAKGGFSAALQMPAGEYYLRVKAAANWTSALYTLRADPSAIQALDPGARLDGVLRGAGDADVYRLSLAEAAVTTLQLSFAATDSPDEAVTVSLEQNGASLWSRAASGESGGFAAPLQIPAGEYYIRVKAGAAAGAEIAYTIGRE